MKKLSLESLGDLGGGRARKMVDSTLAEIEAALIECARSGQKAKSWSLSIQISGKEKQDGEYETKVKVTARAPRPIAAHVMKLQSSGLHFQEDSADNPDQPPLFE